MDIKIGNEDEDSGYLFNVDILIKEKSNALALQLLMEMINKNEQVLDFRVKSGIELGEIIESLIQNKKKSMISKNSLKNNTFSKLGNNEKRVPILPIPIEDKPQIETTKLTPATVGSSLYNDDPTEWINLCIKGNRLVRMTTNRQGQKKSIPCRILNYDQTNQLINVYHVDEKQVYSFLLNEIDEFDAR
ncbi:hypothetical protein [Paenibacillus sp. IHBB 10380]|uniref:hypothetical protein n=1 Tax=Paenibacillus sp. IHBB 10380 TaxID=1566358 RepID=UPI0005CFA476|nr:hypothetical protein [Paenibacillus sp. IHBB 10380]AJS59629.1 hypothetical protein UB51_15410 [Paenibacillus sp. IHBB 10380]